MVKKLTLDEVKSKLSEITKDIIIIDNQYLGNKYKLECKCLVCDHEWKMNWNNLSNNHGCPNCYENNRQIPESEIVEFIKSQQYEFMSFVNKGSARETRIIIKCPEEHSYEVNWSTFQGGRRCRKCADIQGGIKRRHSIEDVKKEIESFGYSFSDDFNYENNKTLFTLYCKDGHKRVTNYSGFCSYKECSECVLGRKYRYSEEDAILILKNLELEYISGYINNHTPFRYICNCGNEANGRLKDLRNGHRCFECSGDKKYTLEQLNSIFNEHECELLTREYTGVYQKLEFVCKCGRIGNKLLNDFRKNSHCAECGIENRSGERHHNWNSNLTEEDRLRNRKYPEYEQWRLGTFERDNYTCQCCGDDTGGNLNAHHLNSHDWDIDNRLNIDNAITLCDICHTDFHKLYGYGDNTIEQYEEYIQELLSSAM